MSLVPATELDAVNLMLATIGESPVATLEQSGQVDAVTAQSTLSEVSAEIQARGWHFNTDKAYPLYASADAPHEIAVPANAARVDPAGPSAHLDLAVRGNRLWDRRRHSFAFPDQPIVRVDIVWALPFADMPQPARRFAAIRAARVFQDRVVGAGNLHAFTEKDEARAEAALRKYEAKTARRSILNSSHAVMRVLNRRAR